MNGGLGQDQSVGIKFESAQRNGKRIAGVSLVASAFLLVFAMLHHPVAHSHDFDGFVQSVRDIEPLNRAVHGGAIVLLAVVSTGLSIFASSIGWSRFTVRLAMSSIAIGCLAMIIAAMISGFIVPRYLDGLDFEVKGVEEIGVNSIRVMRSFNQCFDLLGVASLSAGVFLFGIAVLLQQKRNLMIGLSGVVVGVSGVVGIFAGFTGANVSGVIGFASILAVWLTAVGVSMLKNSKSINR